MKELEPQSVFHFFGEICKIPHGSGNEKRISEYLVKFAEERNLEVYADSTYNVLIKKQGSKGYESSPTIIMQAHIDMVCEKNEDKDHDFLKDPITIKIDGDFITADQTTLGADDGIGVAYMLAILDSKDCDYPPIEALFTSSEEVGMDGAIAFDYSKLSGKTLINIDSEDEGKLYISCAGGMRSYLHIPVELKEGKGQLYQIFITGLKGGHSGMDITLERGNANKLMGRFLGQLVREFSYDLSFIEGGGKDNAIAREARAVVCINPEDKQKLQHSVSLFEKEIRNEYKVSDKDVKVICEETTGYKKVLTDDSKENVLTALLLTPNGVQSMSVEIEKLPESSINLGVVTFNGNEVVLASAIRSSLSSKKFYILDQIERIAKVVKGTVKTNGLYPGWQYNPDSPLRTTFESVYEKMYGKKAEIVAVHAGLECGIFAEKIKGVDIISFGPNLYNVHTPYEKMSISSVKRTWDYLLAVMKALI